MQLIPQIIGALIICGLVAGFGLAASIDGIQDGDQASWVFMIATALVCLLIAWRYVGIRIVASEDGLLIRGFWRSRRVGWEEVKRIRWSFLRGSWPTQTNYYGATFDTERGTFRTWALTRLRVEPRYAWQSPARAVWEELDRRARHHGVDSTLATSTPT